MWHSIYFISYAVIATVAAIIITWGQFVRYRKEKTPFNFTLVLVLVAVALAMWMGAGFTVFAYEPNTTTAGVAAFFLGISLSTFVAWQVNKAVKRIESDSKIIAELSTNDSLTGMLNRRVFQESLKREFVRTIEFSQSMSVVMFDVDNLPDINKRYGFKGGDLVLRELGQRFAKSVPLRSIDIAFRFRSDKFALIFPHIGEAEAVKLAKEVQSSLTDTPYDIGTGSPITVTFTMGLASFSADKPMDMETDLIDNALCALEFAKRAGRGSICTFKTKEDCPLVG